MTTPHSAATGLARRVFQDVRAYLGQTLLAQVALLGGGIVVARLLGPTDYGLWSALQLLTIYGAYASLGFLNALNREVPIHRGRGEEAKVARMRDASLGGTVGLSVLLGGGIFAYALWHRERLDPNLLMGIAFMAGIVALQQISGFFDVLFRSANDFATVGRLRLYRTLAEMTLAVVFVSALSFLGRLLAALATWVFLIGYAIRRNSFRLRPRWDPGEVGRLIRLGLPLMAVEVLYGTLTSLDRVMIAHHLDRTALGYYSVGLMVVSFLFVVPRVVWEVLYPRFGERFGETGQAAALERLVLVPLFGMAGVMALLVGVVVIILPVGLAVVLPGYMEGLDAARVLVWGAFFLALVAGPGNFVLTVTRRQTWLILVYGAGVGFAAAFSWIALSLGYGILGVALGTTLAYALVATALLLYVLAHFSGRRQSFLRLLGLYAPLGLVALFLTVFEYFMPTPRAFGFQPVGVVAVKLVAFGGLVAGILAQRSWAPIRLLGWTAPLSIVIEETKRG
jgi:O-antigen/teichoic acid export membrane protein